jgi:predicted nuclease of predicted toxin-antitoxin system
MPRTIRFHLDEDTDPAIAAGLRHHGIDVTTSQEMRLLAAVDTVQLAHARAERQVLLTHDADHLALSAQGVEHFGISVSR